MSATRNGCLQTRPPNKVRPPGVLPSFRPWGPAIPCQMARNYIQTNPLTLRPLEAPPADVEAFADYDEQRKVWRITRDICLVFLDVPFRSVGGRHWRARPGVLEVDAGFEWDGASGPVINDHTAVLASLVHDIACSVVLGAHVLVGYFRRHWLYYRTARAQGMGRWRAGWHLRGLVLFNAPWEAVHRGKG